MRMLFNPSELEDLYGKLIVKIKSDLYTANAEQNVEHYLRYIHYDSLIQQYNQYYDKRNAKVAVICDSRINLDDMKKIIKKKGLRPSRFEFYLDYDKLTNLDMNKFKNSIYYSDLIFGPNPHKTKGIDGYSSAISMIQNESEQFPKLIIAESNSELKITKTSFEKAIENTQMYLDIYEGE